jgi:hypothetical protein
MTKFQLDAKTLSQYMRPQKKAINNAAFEKILRDKNQMNGYFCLHRLLGPNEKIYELSGAIFSLVGRVRATQGL